MTSRRGEEVRELGQVVEMAKVSGKEVDSGWDLERVGAALADSELEPAPAWVPGREQELERALEARTIRFLYW